MFAAGAQKGAANKFVHHRIIPRNIAVKTHNVFQRHPIFADHGGIEDMVGHFGIIFQIVVVQFGNSLAADGTLFTQISVQIKLLAPVGGIIGQIGNEDCIGNRGGL